MLLLQSSVSAPLARALLFPILFLAPGFLALRPARWTAQLGDTLSRLQKVVYSVVFSSSSFFLIYLVGSLLNWEPLSPDDIDFAAFVAIVPVHFLLTVLIGVVVGSFFHNYVGTVRGLDEFDSWEFVFRRYGSDEVLVRTNSGKEVRGEILETPQIDRSEGVLLTDSNAASESDTAAVEDMFANEEDTTTSRWPAVQRQETEHVRLEDSDAQYTYFPREDIETVFFLGELIDDPNRTEKDQNDRAQSFLSDVYTHLKPHEIGSQLRWWVSAVSNPYTLFVTALLSLAGCVFLLTTAHPQLGHATEVALFGGFGACGTASVAVSDSRWSKGDCGFWLFYLVLVGLISLVFVAGRIGEPLAITRGVLVGCLVGSLSVSVGEEYGVRVAAYLTIVLSSVVVLSHSVFGGVGSQITQRLVLGLLLVIVAALGVNRLRVGTAEEFDDWERVTADAVKWLLFGVVAAGVAIPSQLASSVVVSAVSLAMLVPAVVLGPVAVWRVTGS